MKLKSIHFVLVGFLLLLQSCGRNYTTITVKAPQTSTSSVILTEKPFLSNNKIKLTILEIVGTGDRFGLNGRLSPDGAVAHYMVRIKLSIENLSDSPIDFGDTGIFWMNATANDKHLNTSGICKIFGKSHMCFNGSAVTIESKIISEFFVYYVVPNNTEILELKLIKRK